MGPKKPVCCNHQMSLHQSCDGYDLYRCVVSWSHSRCVDHERPGRQEIVGWYDHNECQLADRHELRDRSYYRNVGAVIMSLRQCGFARPGETDEDLLDRMGVEIAPPE